MRKFPILIFTSTVFFSYGQLCFNKTTKTAGVTVTGVAAADFNNDGKKDLAVANYSNNFKVAVLIGTGTGSFTGPTYFSTYGDGAWQLACGDFNQDTNSDIAVANSSNNEVSILYGNGNGSFGTAATFTLSNSPTCITSADFNGDNQTDIAVGSGSGNIDVFINNGGGNFSIKHTTGVMSSMYDIKAGDFDNDQKMDILLSQGAGGSGVLVLLGLGNGYFGSALVSPGGVVTSHGIDRADFNNDGKLDAVVGDECAYAYSLSVVMGLGNGYFAQPTNLFADSIPSAVVADDFDGDGNADIAATNVGSGNISVFLGNGSGTFSPAVNFYAGSSPISIISADINNDGVIDILSGLNGASSVAILKNCTAVGLSEVESSPLEIFPNPASYILHFNNRKSSEIHIELTNNFGVVVFEKDVLPNSSQTTDLIELNDGIYFLFGLFEGKRFIKKIVIQH